MSGQALLVALAVVWLTPAAVAQQRPTARSVRASEPPVVDGDLTDAVWALAEPIGPLTQVEPVQGAEPSERTEVRIAHDDRFLYIAVRCFDREPHEILATQPERDARLDPDDRIEIVIDTFHDRRNAYFFQMNAVGSRGDALVNDNGRRFNKPWDGIWYGQARIDELGWTAEMALPFQTMAFAPEAESWGFNISRYVRRRNEVHRWAGISRDYGLFQISEAGDLVGLEGLHQGLGLDVTPYLKGAYSMDREHRRNVLDGDAGLDAQYRITPNLRASFTANTDFAEAEVDNRVINLSRFPLFFPERRDFFLEDAGQFQFADLGNDLIPFFSRRVGLVDGQEVPLDVGLKLSGREGAWSIGSLGVRTGDRTRLDSQDLFVTRVSHNVDEALDVGGIITEGDPEGLADNRVVGFDTNFRTTSFNGGQRLDASAWALESDTEGLRGDNAAFGASLRMPNDRWSWGVAAKEIQEDFHAALGFVPRTGIRSYRGDLSFRPRAADDVEVRRYEFQVEGNVITGTDGATQSTEFEVQPFGIQWESGDRFELEVEALREVLDDDFEITDGVVIPKGDHDWRRVRFDLRTSDHRVVSGFLVHTTGGFYTGDWSEWVYGLDWRPSPGFTGGLEWVANRFALPEGHFENHLARLRANWFFGPDVSWSNFVQWDDDSNLSSLNSRLRWIPEPGQEVFFVLNQSWLRENDSTRPRDTRLTAKGGYTVRF